MSEKDKDKPTNSAKGRESFDVKIGNSVVGFLNRNNTPYPTEVGGPKFDLIPIKEKKDVMINAARMHAEQEYNRIMELVVVLQKQAAELKRRLDITDMVHAAHYQFQLYHGQIYWLVYDHAKKFTRLSQTGPNDWYTGVPEGWEYICKVKWLGDHTFQEIGDEE